LALEESDLAEEWPELFAELNYIQEYILKFSTQNDNGTFVIAGILFLQKQYDQALERIKQHQNHVSKIFGRDCGIMRTVFKWKLKCYIKLQKKTNADACLKQFKKYCVLDSSEYQNLKRSVEKLKGKVVKKVKVKSEQKCAVCDEIESYCGEFKTCSACRIPVYCSKKCQRQHWKNGHRKQCGKRFKV
jgi:hypothetical protein